MCYFCTNVQMYNMITLYLARHGQTRENLDRIFQGHLPGHLTSKGIEQADLLREKVMDIKFDSALCSDLKRAVDTMRIVLEGRDIMYRETSLLREINWGSWTGLKIKDVDLNNFPSDVETEAMLYERGGRFVQLLRENFCGNVLAIGHGLINRAIQANIENIPLTGIRTVPKMDNCEIRRFIL